MTALLTVLLGMFAPTAQAMPVPPPPSFDVVIVENSPGGVVEAFLAARAMIEAAGARVEIKGYCASACTLLADLPKACVHKGARLGFHADFLSNQSVEGVRLYDSQSMGQVIMAHYSKPMRDWIEAHGGLGYDIIWLQGKELEAIIPRCDAHPVS